MNCLFKAEFPEITLCSEGGGYKSNILLENGFLSSSDYSGYKQIILHSFFVFLIGNYIYTIHQVKVLVILSYLILSYLILSYLILSYLLLQQLETTLGTVLILQ